MKSGAPAMLESNWMTQEEVVAMEKDIDAIISDENAIFIYQFVQAKATV
jgi:hypothetical protein